jgi:RimJ/RimL family protein N-acetyltransferase
VIGDGALWHHRRMLHDLILEGYGTRLVPLDASHAAELATFIDADLWRGMTSPVPVGPAAVEANIRAATEAPGRLAFAVLDAATGEVRGSTSFYDWEPRQLRVEIGHTYYAPRWWGTSNNPACKLLMLRHAFDTWGCARVALRADARNTRSLAAIARLGAKPEGVLRSHRVAPDGSRGDTAYFSILADEWPAVRDGLLARLTTARTDA